MRASYPNRYEDAFVARDQSNLLLGSGAKLRSGMVLGNQKFALFPTAFTLFCVITFFVPIWLLSTYIGRDMHAEYFLGQSAARPVLCLPVLYLATHVVHVCIGKPSQCLILVCLFGSGLMMVVLGDQVRRASTLNAKGLISDDCQSFLAKSELEQQWQTARTFYATCILATANITNTSFEEDVQKYRLHDCAGYEAQLAMNPGWVYLEKLEERERCAGWCSKSQALWTLEPVKESCTVAVAEVMREKIVRGAKQTIGYSLIALLFLGIGSCIGAPVLQDWFGN